MPERLDGWIDDPGSEVMVCADETGEPMALMHVMMLSGTEGWLEAARVHPDHRREGLGTRLNKAGVAWAHNKGARVVRLATEAGNKASRAQVESLGYRRTSSWVHSSIEIRPDYRSPYELRLRPAPGSDVDAAWMFWSTSELAHAGRSFAANGWHWRRARPSDLATAASTGEFYQNPAGWVIADQPSPDVVRAGWLATTTEEAPRLLDGLIAHAADREATELTVKLPNLAWSAEALVRAGGQIVEVAVYSLAV